MGTQKQDIEKLFTERLPSHGYATDDLQYGVRFLPLQLAIQKAIIQYNWKHSLGWLAYDVDSKTARFDWDDRGSPPPNILIMNPDNGHGHLLYGLERPVHNYSDARDKPLRYLASIDVAMTEELRADPGYSKLLCKNPLNERWTVLYPRLELYTLDELASWVDINKYQDRRRRLPTIGLGRNCTLFETLRVWAYRERRQAYLSEELYHYRVISKALAINAEFDPPLPHSEVRATAKSVSRWTWRRMSKEGFKKWQKGMSIAGNKAKQRKSLELRKRIVEIAEQCPDLTQEDYAAMLGVTRETINRHLRQIRKCDIPYIR